MQNSGSANRCDWQRIKPRDLLDGKLGRKLENRHRLQNRLQSGIGGFSNGGKVLKRLVGASGFEPPTSWSRTRRSSQAEPRPDNISLAFAASLHKRLTESA